METDIKEVKTLYDLYRQLNVSGNLVQSSEVFTIHNLVDIGFKLPYRSQPFRPNYFSFLFVKNGVGAYTIDDQTFHAEPYSIYFTNPSNYRTFSWEKIEEVYLITFDEDFLRKYLREDVFDNFPFLLTETLSPKNATPSFYAKVEEIYLLMYREYHAGGANKYKIIGNLLSVLLFYIKEYFWEEYNPIYEGNRKSQIVKSFKQLLEKHYRDLTVGKIEVAYGVQDYAAAQGLHPSYFSSVIKSKTGKPIVHWIGEKTTSIAKSMLQNSQTSIKEITYRLGFSETAHFSNHFKKHTGISPTQYREHYQNGQPI
ncbi:AraC-like DNA-binding protein [Larkinella arboricola]|uniref:AraC-like DNA-binding protein n=1 Tax=Larkinella arboricola TaxID=643671 RepID=A0A327WJS0_LARAB|nr:helix-turn-helix domain-containing protein [Larkinella arboricola]RAJ91053.1 AraC-like DNA-binding protein [Larkinella arboricola]